MLVVYDTLVYLLVTLFILVIYPSSISPLSPDKVLLHILAGFVILFSSRFIFRVYSQIWRYAGPSEYFRLIVADAAAGAVYLAVDFTLLPHITFVRALSLFALNLLGCMTTRLIYQWIYQRRSMNAAVDRFGRRVLKIATGVSFAQEKSEQSHLIRVAIIGAGSIGASLADEFLQNPTASYAPVCFVDIDEGKVGRAVCGLPVISTEADMHRYGVQEVVFALPNVDAARREELYHFYKDLGYKIKTYDFLSVDAERRHLHDFAIEDLLMRQTTSFLDDRTKDWYKDKNVLITGGGGSIGSELARQIARCAPKRLVILDVYENGAYDIQQELRMRYGDSLNLRVEIASVCDRDKIWKIFREHTPDIVLHVAAHKHVPLMERNVCEAVSNNVFGTLNVVEACEALGVKRFIMVSTDKAVNPTNVMGATKRMCEMIVQSRDGKSTSFSATRFGNVLGSNGSVIPLFKRQIARGGPVTITDKRIIRYFMTIPEASQLVMTSGAMAKNGELYVLDMGKPVKIMDLAENMIRLSGLEPGKDIEIVETGLRPGEKLYEELLIKTEELDRTENNLIFVERDRPLPQAEIREKLEVLRKALETQSNREVKQALMQVVPTYHTPEEVNKHAVEAEEMHMA